MNQNNIETQIYQWVRDHKEWILEYDNEDKCGPMIAPRVDNGCQYRFKGGNCYGSLCMTPCDSGKTRCNFHEHPVFTLKSPDSE